MNFIFAMSANRVIGHIDETTNQHELPWYIPEDLAYFSKVTRHSIVIMGRKTFDSLHCKPLPNRINIVLTRSPCPPVVEEEKASSLYFSSFEDLNGLLDRLQTDQEKPIFVIGGGEIFSLLFPFCAKIYVTLINITVTATKTKEKELGNKFIFCPSELEDVTALGELTWKSEVHVSRNENIEFLHAIIERTPARL